LIFQSFYKYQLFFRNLTIITLFPGLQPCIETILNITRFNDINITSSQFECALLVKKIRARSSQKSRFFEPSVSSLGLGSSLGSGSRTSGSSLSSGTSGMGSSMSSRCKILVENDFIFHTKATEPEHYIIWCVSHTSESTYSFNKRRTLLNDDGFMKG
jgi:hypothetical protein